MGRLKKFALGVASGYVAMAANVAFTILSVPLALRYLSNEAFALWALISQLVSYLILIDGGIGVAVGRILADYKDQPDEGHYGSVLKSSFAVFVLQGLVVAGVGIFIAPWAADWFEVGSDDRSAFIFVLRGQAIAFSLLFFAKVLAVPFWSHQRYDVVNWASTLGFALNGIVMALSFRAGWGLKSLLAGQYASVIVFVIWTGIAVARLNLFPSPRGWGRLEAQRIREIVPFARDLFIMAVGNQLLTASQIIVISKTLGLHWAAIWTVCSKSFVLAQQVVARLFESSAGALTEMLVRNESVRLAHRFRQIVALSASLSVAAASLGIVANGAFVEVWTKGRMEWRFENDLLMGLFLIVFSVGRCFTSFVGVTRNLRSMRFVYFFEGITFLAIALLAVHFFGVAGIIVAATVATAIWSGAFGLKEASQFLNQSVKSIASTLLPSGRLAGLCIPCSLALRKLMSACTSVVHEIAIVSGAALLMALALWRFGLDSSLREEIRVRLRLG